VTSVALVAAVSENGVIGRGGGLPWHLPDDFRWFQRLTKGHVLIMGRRTFESLDRPLPDRRLLVLSRDPAFDAGGATVVPSLADALAAAGDVDRVFVAGGAAVYRAALPRADRLFITRVHASVEGDVLFPEVDWSRWTLTEENFHPADERHAHAFTIRCYERGRPPTRDVPEKPEKTIA
jgi:dihydrofolate reductase